MLLCSISTYAQWLPNVEYIEVISEVEDSMILINKLDAEKINKICFEKNKLDSVVLYQDSTIFLLENKISVQDSIITKTQFVLNNEVEINRYLTKHIKEERFQYEQLLRKEKWKKIGWQVATGAAVIGIILALTFK